MRKALARGGQAAKLFGRNVNPLLCVGLSGSWSSPWQWRACVVPHPGPRSWSTPWQWHYSRLQPLAEARGGQTRTVSLKKSETSIMACWRCAARGSSGWSASWWPTAAAPKVSCGGRRRGSSAASSSRSARTLLPSLRLPVYQHPKRRISTCAPQHQTHDGTHLRGPLSLGEELPGPLPAGSPSRGHARLFMGLQAREGRAVASRVRIFSWSCETVRGFAGPWRAGGCSRSSGKRPWPAWWLFVTRQRLADARWWAVTPSRSAVTCRAAMARLMAEATRHSTPMPAGAGGGPPPRLVRVTWPQSAWWGRCSASFQPAEKPWCPRWARRRFFLLPRPAEKPCALPARPRAARRRVTGARERERERETPTGGRVRRPCTPGRQPGAAYPPQSTGAATGPQSPPPVV